MARSGITWTFSPAQMGRNAERLGDRLPDAVEDVMAFHAADGHVAMVEDAPWTDRTVVARGGLYGQSFREGTVVGMVLGGTAEYQIWLELKNGGRYAAIVPELRRRLPMVAHDIDEVLA